MLTKTVDLSDREIIRDYLVALLQPGIEIILTDGEIVLAKLTPIEQNINSTKERTPDQYPTLWVSDDFDDLLPGEYWLDEQA